MNFRRALALCAIALALSAPKGGDAVNTTSPPALADTSVYKLATNGNCVGTGAWIESKAGCEAAATSLGLPKTTAIIQSDKLTTTYPYSCYWEKSSKFLRWNPSGKKTDRDRDYGTDGGTDGTPDYVSVCNTTGGVAAYARPPDTSMYKLATHGNCVGTGAWIETAAGCEAAARSLGLPVTTATGDTRTTAPYGCTWSKDRRSKSKNTFIWNPSKKENRGTDSSHWKYASICNTTGFVVADASMPPGPSNSLVLPTNAPKGIEYTCKAHTAIPGTPDVKLSNGKTDDTGYSKSECEQECSANAACKSFVYADGINRVDANRAKGQTYPKGYCAMWSKSTGASKVASKVHTGVLGSWDSDGLQHCVEKIDYELADKGTCSGVGGWISSWDKCAVAAADLGMNVSTVRNISSPMDPYGCFYQETLVGNTSAFKQQSIFIKTPIISITKELFWNPAGVKADPWAGYSATNTWRVVSKDQTAGLTAEEYKPKFSQFSLCTTGYPYFQLAPDSRFHNPWEICAEPVLSQEECISAGTALYSAGACEIDDDIEIKEEPEGCFLVCKNGIPSFKFNDPLAYREASAGDDYPGQARQCREDYPCVCRVPGAIVATHNIFDHPLYDKCAATFHNYNPLPYGYALNSYVWMFSGIGRRPEHCYDDGQYIGFSRDVPHTARSATATTPGDGTGLAGAGDPACGPCALADAVTCGSSTRYPSQSDDLAYLCVVDTLNCGKSEQEALIDTLFYVSLLCILAAGALACLACCFMAKKHSQPLLTAKDEPRTRQTLLLPGFTADGNVRGRLQFVPKVMLYTAYVMSSIFSVIVHYRTGGPLNAAADYAATDFCNTGASLDYNKEMRESQKQFFIVTDFDAFHGIAVTVCVVCGFLWAVQVAITCGQATAVGAGTDTEKEESNPAKPALWKLLDWQEPDFELINVFVAPIRLLVSATQLLMLMAFMFTMYGVEDRQEHDDENPYATTQRGYQLFALQVIYEVLVTLYTLVTMLMRLPRVYAVLSSTETSLNPKKKTNRSSRVVPVSDTVSDTTK